MVVPRLGLSYGARLVGLELGWPELGSQIACGSCLEYGRPSLEALLWGTAVVLNWSLAGQNSALILFAARVWSMAVPALRLGSLMRHGGSVDWSLVGQNSALSLLVACVWSMVVRRLRLSARR